MKEGLSGFVGKYATNLDVRFLLKSSRGRRSGEDIKVEPQKISGGGFLETV